MDDRILNESTCYYHINRLRLHTKPNRFLKPVRFTMRRQTLTYDA
jgi:hypothetical protein